MATKEMQVEVTTKNTGKARCDYFLKNKPNQTDREVMDVSSWLEPDQEDFQTFGGRSGSVTVEGEDASASFTVKNIGEEEITASVGENSVTLKPGAHKTLKGSGELSIKLA